MLLCFYFQVCIQCTLLLSVTLTRVHASGFHHHLPPNVGELDHRDSPATSEDTAEPHLGNYSVNGPRQISVYDYGAKGDGVSDDTQAFRNAWNASCQVYSSTLEVPAGGTFLIGAITFAGPCLGNLVFQVDGKVVAPSCGSRWSSPLPSDWILFFSVSVTLQGSGRLDGAGQTWWRSASKSIARPYLMRFSTCSNAVIHGLNIRNAPQIHLKIDTCVCFRVSNITISASATSPNTDGINMANSHQVGLRSIKIATGDDCIAIKTGCSDVAIHNILCGPGHGISIGGLGENGSYAAVSNISVHNVWFVRTMYGVRIKTWQGGSGFVTGVSFRNISLNRVENPIVIDQYYCNGYTNCTANARAVQVSNIIYSGIAGSSSTLVGVDFACSDSVACTNIGMSDINITYSGSGWSAQSFCRNAYGWTAADILKPPSCLMSIIS